MNNSRFELTTKRLLNETPSDSDSLKLIERELLVHDKQAKKAFLDTGIFIICAPGAYEEMWHEETKAGLFNLLGVERTAYLYRPKPVHVATLEDTELFATATAGLHGQKFHLEIGTIEDEVFDMELMANITPGSITIGKAQPVMEGDPTLKTALLHRAKPSELLWLNQITNKMSDSVRSEDIRSGFHLFFKYKEVSSFAALIERWNYFISRESNNGEI